MPPSDFSINQLTLSSLRDQLPKWGSWPGQILVFRPSNNLKAGSVYVLILLGIMHGISGEVLFAILACAGILGGLAFYRIVERPLLVFLGAAGNASLSSSHPTRNLFFYWMLTLGTH